MKKFLLLFVLIINIYNHSFSQLALSNFNSAGMNGWTMINDANNPDPAIWTASYIPLFKNNAFVKIRRATGDSALFAPAKFSPAAAPDRWLISPEFKVNGATCYLLLDYLGNEGNSTTEQFDVLVSTNGGTSKADFTIFNNFSGNNIAKIVPINLGLLNNQTVRLAIRYKSTKGFGCTLDNIRTVIFPDTNLVLTSVDPKISSPKSYGLVNELVTISGRVFNLGAGGINDYKIYFQEGTGTPVVEDVSLNGFPIATLSSGSFTFNTKYKIPSIGKHDLKIWIKVSGDTTKSDDTLYTTIIGVSKKPTKKVTIEEGTGTWCGWCPRGAVFMDSFSDKKLNGVTIAVHNNDTMEVSSYDSKLTSIPGFTGFPSIVVDRRIIANPDKLFVFYDSLKNDFGYAEMKRTVPQFLGNAMSVDVTVRPYADLNGDYRVVLVISEDSVRGTHDTFKQVNYYSGGGVGSMSYKGFDFANQANPVPAKLMNYNHVARGIFPSFSGDASTTLPSTMTAFKDYKVTISGILNTSWNKSRLHYNILLVDNKTGYVCNALNDTGFLSTDPSGGGGGIDSFYGTVSNVLNTSVGKTKSISGLIPGLIIGDSFKWIIKSSNVEIPSSWNIVSVCDPKDCYIYSNDLSNSFKVLSNSNLFKVDFEHNNTVGYGYCLISLWKPKDSANSFKNYKFSLLTSAGQITTSIISNENDKLLYYFDNTIFVDRDFKDATLNIFDISGKLVSSNKISTTTIDFNKFPKGIYMANVEKAGTLVKSLKFDSSK